MLSIVKREFKNYFSSPLGYVVMAILLAFSGSYYYEAFYNGYANMDYVFSAMITIILFVTPVLTMRLFSEEKRLKTDQLLMTAPVSISSIVLGKFFALVLYFLVFVAAMVVYNFVFFFFGATPNMIIFFGNIIGILLFTSSLFAIGIFISALTESQVVAAVGSFAVSFFLLIIESSQSASSTSVLSKIMNITFIKTFCEWLSFSERYYSFAEGVFDIANFVFFLSIIVAFLFLTVRTLDRKRWA